ncbi:MAG: hypothetical protein Q4D16_21470 [Eubacteriales bacterium]|nr:hypothetical protein [Eubacteriales bacterium]
MNQKKYEITDISHPKYPWLHRIRALCKVNEQVEPGMLGGYVQSEENLSQEGTSWIYDEAISCEEAVVTKDGRMYDRTVARDSALVGGDARLFEYAKAEGHSCILSGELKENARAAGEAVVQKAETGEAPVIGRSSHIYGTVCGWFVINDHILPGETLVNPTQDMILIESGKRGILVKQRDLEPPKRNIARGNKKNDKER